MVEKISYQGFHVPGTPYKKCSHLLILSDHVTEDNPYTAENDYSEGFQLNYLSLGFQQSWVCYPGLRIYSSSLLMGSWGSCWTSQGNYVKWIYFHFHKFTDSY